MSAKWATLKCITTKKLTDSWWEWYDSRRVGKKGRVVTKNIGAIFPCICGHFRAQCTGIWHLWAQAACGIGIMWASTEKHTPSQPENHWTIGTLEWGACIETELFETQLPSLEQKKFALENRPFCPKKEIHLPTIRFPMLVSGRVDFNQMLQNGAYQTNQVFANDTVSWCKKEI